MERPILFSGEMVRAILAGRKTQTRRVVRHRHDWTMEEREDGSPWPFFLPYVHAEDDVPVPCPYGAPGDRLWVKEAWHACPHCGQDYDGQPGPVTYRADDPRHNGPKCAAHGWRSPIYMPRWASRLTLAVTAVRVERLQDITAEDVQAEGIVVPRCTCEVCARSLLTICTADASVYVEEYRALWDRINGKRAPWSSNPWVWVVSFRKAVA